jgi:hypothetical protein
MIAHFITTGVGTSNPTMMNCVLAKFWCTSTRLYGVTTQRTTIWIFTAVRTSVFLYFPDWRSTSTLFFHLFHGLPTVSLQRNKIKIWMWQISHQSSHSTSTLAFTAVRTTNLFPATFSYKNSPYVPCIHHVHYMIAVGDLWNSWSFSFPPCVSYLGSDISLGILFFPQIKRQFDCPTEWLAELLFCRHIRVYRPSAFEEVFGMTGVFKPNINKHF